MSSPSFLKKDVKTNPVLFSIEDDRETTEVERHYLRNTLAEFGCSAISLKADRKARKRPMRHTFEK